MISAESLLTHTLRSSSYGAAVSRILAAALNAVEPGEAVRRHVRREGEQLTVAGRVYDLSSFRRVHLLGIGKASVAMAEALAGILGERLERGLVVSKQAPSAPLPAFDIIIGGHPVPDERSLAAGEKVAALAASLGPGDLLFCVISGGGSALVTAPVEGVSLSDIQELTSLLLACGARIDEINTLRRRLDRIKGGGLARLANGAAIVSLIVSDVVGNPLEAIASGPTAPDPTTRAQALAVVEKYGLKKKIPASILAALKKGAETPKPGEALFSNVQNVLVASNLAAAQAALDRARQEGFHPYLLRTDLQGEARQAAFELATFLRQAKQTGQPVPSPACLIAGGETTVTLQGDGKGGRNTELALAAVTELADYPGVMLVTLASDGEDGPTDAAGAVVSGDTFRRAAGLGLRPGEFLERNDSYSFFAALDDLLKPGPTGTNVGDLTFMFSV
jgi:hydroxypyruvate reductase